MLLALAWGATQDFALSVRVRRASNELFADITKDGTGVHLNRTAARWALAMSGILQGQSKAYVDDRIVANLYRNQTLYLHQGMMERKCVPEYLEFLDKMIGTAHDLGLPKTTRSFIDGYTRMVVLLDKTPRSNQWPVETEKHAVDMVGQTLELHPDLAQEYLESLNSIPGRKTDIETISGNIFVLLSEVGGENGWREYLSRGGNNTLDQ